MKTTCWENNLGVSPTDPGSLPVTEPGLVGRRSDPDPGGGGDTRGGRTQVGLPTSTHSRVTMFLGLARSQGVEVSGPGSISRPSGTRPGKRDTFACIHTVVEGAPDPFRMRLDVTRNVGPVPERGYQDPDPVLYWVGVGRVTLSGPKLRTGGPGFRRRNRPIVPGGPRGRSPQTVTLPSHVLHQTRPGPCERGHPRRGHSGVLVMS